MCELREGQKYRVFSNYDFIWVAERLVVWYSRSGGITKSEWQKIGEFPTEFQAMRAIKEEARASSNDRARKEFIPDYKVFDESELL